MTSLLVFIWYPNRKRLFDYPKGKAVPVSIVMPCYNEETQIESAMENYMNELKKFGKKLIRFLAVISKIK